MPFRISDVDKHKKGLTPQQKRQWVEVANSVLNKCIEKGGTDESCAPSAIRQANGVVGNMENNNLILHKIQANNYTVRVENLDGRSHIIVPVIMMVDGVHNGSHGPLLHLSEEFGKIPGSWNGIPVSISHPEQDGISVSANSPEIIETQTIGRIFNTHLDGNKLKAEAWIDELKAQQIYPELIEDLRHSRPIEVSTGVYTEDEENPGVWNEEQYTAIARNYRPDHLALLPNEIGACSIEDGCGIRTNKEDKNIMDDLNKTIKSLAEKGMIVIQQNEMSFGDISHIIQGKLDSMDDDVKIHYLQEVFKDYFVYSISPRGTGGSKLMKRNYTLSNNDMVEFTGEPVEVVRKTEFVQTNQKGENLMSNKKNEKNCPECENKVNLLIQCKETKFTEDDRAELSTLSEGVLDKLFAEQKPDETPTKEDALKVLKEELSDKDKFMKLVPPDVRKHIELGLKLHEDQKTKIISEITAYESNIFTEDELKAKDIDELQKLARLIPQKENYVGVNAGVNLNTNTGNEEQPLPPAGVTVN